MSAQVAPHAADAALSADLIAHLDGQIESAGRLLSAILQQGAAIRRNDVDAVLARLTDVKTEMAQRGRLEEERVALLRRAGVALGVVPGAVTLEGIATLLPPPEAQHARTRSAQLRGLLGEIAREHGINRALMRQELAFLEHLVRLIGHEPAAAYGPGPAASGRGGTSSSPRRVLDLEA